MCRGPVGDGANLVLTFIPLPYHPFTPDSMRYLAMVVAASGLANWRASVDIFASSWAFETKYLNFSRKKCGAMFDSSSTTAAPVLAYSYAFWIWWFCAASGKGMRMDGLPRAAISNMEPDPALLTIKSHAAYTCRSSGSLRKGIA